MWYPNRSDGFGVDHFAPKSEQSELETMYENLIYACNRCNSFKRTTNVLPNPSGEAYGDHLRLGDNGVVEGLTLDGKKAIAILHLNDGPALKTRQLVLHILQAKLRHEDNSQIDSIFRSYFGYPEDLPDLRTLKPPAGNEREEATSICYFVMREIGNLPQFY
jgi:hypothetical protein